MTKQKLILVPAKQHILYSGRPDIIGLVSDPMFVYPELIGGYIRPTKDDYQINGWEFHNSSKFKFTIPTIEYWILIHFMIAASQGYRFIFYNSILRKKGLQIIQFLDEMGLLAEKDVILNTANDLSELLQRHNVDYNETYLISDNSDFMISCEELFPPMSKSLLKVEHEFGLNYGLWGESIVNPFIESFDIKTPMYRYNCRRNVFAFFPEIIIEDCKDLSRFHLGKIHDSK